MKGWELSPGWVTLMQDMGLPSVLQFSFCNVRELHVKVTFSALEILCSQHISSPVAVHPEVISGWFVLESVKECWFLLLSLTRNPGEQMLGRTRQARLVVSLVLWWKA